MLINLWDTSAARHISTSLPLNRIALSVILNMMKNLEVNVKLRSFTTFRMTGEKSLNTEYILSNLLILSIYEQQNQQIQIRMEHRV